MRQELQNFRFQISDFVDCYLAARSKGKDVSVYSFDKKDFTKLKVNRKVP